MARRRVLDGPFAPLPDVPGASAARGITLAIPAAFALWAMSAMVMTPIL